MTKIQLEQILKDHDKIRKCENRVQICGCFWCNKNDTDCDYVGQTKLNTSEDWIDYKLSCDYWDYYTKAFIEKSKER